MPVGVGSNSTICLWFPQDAQSGFRSMAQSAVSAQVSFQQEHFKAVIHFWHVQVAKWRTFPREFPQRIFPQRIFPREFHLSHLCQGQPILGLCSVSFSKRRTILFCAVWIWTKQTKSPLLMLQGAENPLPAHGRCGSCWLEGPWRTTPLTGAHAVTVHFPKPLLTLFNCCT